MAKSVQFSVAIDSCRRRCAVTRSKRKTDAFTEPRSPEQRDAPRSWARLSNPQSGSGCFLPRLVVDVMPTVTSAPVHPSSANVGLPTRASPDKAGRTAISADVERRDKWYR